VSLLAQDATVTGIVSDSAGAVVPGVHITIRNVDTNLARTALTGPSGDFTIPSLSPGRYDLVAELAGFRQYRKTGIVLEVGQTLRDDIQLAVGQLTESVQVVAEVAALNTESGTIKGDVIVHQEVQDLPLEGRDFTDLAFLVPGVVRVAEGGQGSFAAINGARADSTNFYVDGFNNRNPRGAAAQARPNLNALQEFKMEVSGYSAEYGRMAGGILNMVLRSGTNELHGDLFHYVRNNIMDARSFFDLEKQKLNRHNFGGTLHGPVYLPRLYDGRSRTFFLYSWESYRQLIGATALDRVPTPLERMGDFSASRDRLGRPASVTDPRDSNRPFPANRIPASRWHPTSVRLLDYYPLPNRVGDFNYLTSANDRDAWDSFIVKLDHRFNERNNVAYRYQIRFNNTSSPFAGSGLGTFGDRSNDDRSLMGIDYTHLFTPAFLVEFHSGFSRNTAYQNTVWAGRDMATELGFVGSTQDPDLLGFPRVTVLDYASLGSAANMPVQFHVTDIQTGVKLIWIKSRHNLKWGYELSRVRINQPYFNNNRGTYAFQDRWTAHPMGDFLLGMQQSSSRTVGVNRNYMRAWSMGAFFNDDFKMRRNLTLNFGLRYELDLPITDRYNQIGNFVPLLGQTVVPSRAAIPDLDRRIAEANYPAGRIGFADELGYPPSLVFADYNNFAPRIGFAWRPRNTQKMVLRGGYGFFYTGHLLNPIRNSLQNQFPFTFTESYSRNTNFPDRVTLSNPFPREIRTLGGVNSANGYQDHAPTGYLQSYNLTIERDLGGGAVLEIGFVGSKGTHLGRISDINVPRRSLEAYLANIPVVQLRPYSYLSGAINLYSFGVNSIYNAGQISLRKRSPGGTFYRLNYSYSKSIDNASQLSGTANGGYAGFQDPNNYKLERGRSDFDIGHLVNASFSWRLPVGRGQRLLASARGMTQAALGGWQLSGTAAFGTGQPLTITAADVDANLGEFNRPNRMRKGVPGEIPGQRRGVDYPWFDRAAFEKVPRCDSSTRTCGPSPNGFLPFVVGNSGRNILDGPGFAYFNMALSKTFRFRERKNLRLRVESFNVMNHPNFRLTGDEFKQFNRPTAGLLSLVSGTGRGGPRVFQASLQFSF
jgi:hypothetical protein